MDAAHLAELLQPFLLEVPHPARAFCEGWERSGPSLTDLQLNNISTYINLLLRWNARINLSAIRDPEEIVTRHFGESLFAARCLPPAAAHSVEDLIDFGSGAGFPGLPIKIWMPHIRLTLVESNHKKATFLREVVRALTLTDVNVYAARAESFSGQASVVTLRAVERFEAALPAAARLLAPAGCLALLIGQAQIATARDLLPGLAWKAPIPIPLSINRVILVGSRV